MRNRKNVTAISDPTPCSSLRLGRMQTLVPGLCTVHENMTITKIARWLERDPSQIASIVSRLEDRGLLHAMRPTSRK